MILSHYTRKDSPWVWIQHAEKGQPKRYHKTSVRKQDPDWERKVLLEMNKLQAKMLVIAPDTSGVKRENWNWVIPWLRTKYAAGSKQKTLKIYLIQWNWLSQFLDLKEIDAPGLLTRQDVFDYIDWRRQQVKKSSGKMPGLNTALGEAKMLGMIMTEAISRGHAVENPAQKLGIEKDDPRETPAMTDAEIALIFAALKIRPAWMQRSFEVAYHTGLRFATTQLRREQVRWDLDDIWIERPKGGKKREFCIPIYPGLRPLLERWWESRAPLLWDVPIKERPMTGLRWTEFFRAVKLPHLKFHSTRTTFITRGAIGDAARGIPPIPEAVMMKLVNHGRLEIHRIYQRFTSENLRSFVTRMPLPELGSSPSAGAAKAGSRSRKTSHP